MRQMIKKAAVVLSVVMVCAPLGAMAANKLIVKGTDGTTDKMVVTDTGYIGIGKTPTIAMDIAGVPGAARVVAQTVGDSVFGGGSFIGLHTSAPTTNSGLPRANDRIGFFLFGSRTGVTPTETLGTATVTGGGVQVYAEAAWTPTSYPTYFTFETAPNGSLTKLERLRVTANGNIGIGSTTPAAKLEVNGGLKLTSVGNSTNNGVAPIKPTCDSTVRGTFWFTRSGVGVADKLEVCIKTTTDTTYSWQLIF